MDKQKELNELLKGIKQEIEKLKKDKRNFPIMKIELKN